MQARLTFPKALTTLLCALWLALAPPLARAQQEHSYTIPHFTFEGGGQLDGMKVSYATWGQRSPADDNVIVLVPATSGVKNWAASHIGPGKAFDTDRWFVVSIDAIGGGGSSQPRDGLGGRFPHYNIRDQVRAQHALLADGLQLKGVAAIAGASSGAYQALEWGVTYPGYARGLVLYSGTARADRHVKAIVDSIVATLSLDPAYVSGVAAPPGGDAVRRAAVVYFPWLGSDAMFEAMPSDDAFAKAQAGFGESWARQWDATGLAWRYQSSRLHDVSAPYGGDMARALARVTGQVLALNVPLDRTHPLPSSQAMVKGLVNAQVTEALLDSPRGHVAIFAGPGSPEHAFIERQTKAFLAGLK